MSEELKIRLKSLDLEFLYGVPVHLTDEMVVQIDDAYRDAGYIKGEIIQPNEMHAYDTTGREVWTNTPRMTGQEWFDRLRSEVKNLDEEEAHKAYAVMLAARRVAGIEEEL